MKKVKVKDAKPGMVITGTVERGDWPKGPFTITAIKKTSSDYYRVTARTLDGTDAGGDEFPAGAHLKVIR
jgi:hypothetical protein